MYWIYLIIFIFAVLAPDIIRSDIGFLPETRVEEILIFLLGISGFVLFALNERRFSLQREEKQRDQKRLTQTVKDLVESYSYIGEVNRRMDILMNIALGISNKSVLDKSREMETYRTIIEASNFLTRSTCSILRFVNLKTGIVEKEIAINHCYSGIKNKELIGSKKETGALRKGDFFIISSPQSIRNVRSYLIIKSPNEPEEKGLELLKVLASQALFLFSYSNQPAKRK